MSCLHDQISIENEDMIVDTVFMCKVLNVTHFRWIDRYNMFFEGGQHYPMFKVAGEYVISRNLEAAFGNLLF